LNQYEVYGGQK